MTPTRITHSFFLIALNVNLFCQELRVQPVLTTNGKPDLSGSPLTPLAPLKPSWQKIIPSPSEKACQFASASAASFEQKETATLAETANSAKKKGSGENEESGTNLALKVFDMHGNRLNNNSWGKMHTIFRFFSNEISNQTGSLEDVIGLALQNVFLSVGRRVEVMPVDFQDSSFADYPSLEIQFNRSRLEWFPSHEFIATIPPRNPGRILVDFVIVSRWKSVSGRNEQAKNCGWEFGLVKKKILLALPGQEAETMSQEASLLFSEWAQQVRSRL